MSHEQTIKLWLPAGLVTIACFAIYGFSIVDGVFQYDDLHAIVGNSSLHSLAHIPSYFTDPGTFSSLTFGGMFRPLVLVSYALTHAISGENPAAYHLGNVVIHATVGVLVASLLLRLGAGRLAAVVAGVWFIAHPVHAEVATYVSSRSESMCTLFMLLCVHLWIGGAGDRVRDWRLPVALLAFALALLSKSVGIVLPGLLLAHDVVRGQTPWKDTGWWRTAAWRHGPFWLLTALYLLLVSDSLGSALLADPVRGMAAQVYTQTKSLVYYLCLLVIPRGLSVEHAFRVSESLADGAVLASAGVLLSVGLVTVWCARSRSTPRSIGISLPDVFWLAWMPIVLLPTLIVPLNVLVNEHRLYPVTIAAAVLLLRVMGGMTPSWGLSVLAGITICFGVMSYQRAQVWGDALTLWSDARDKAPTMPRPYLFVGDGHFQAGRYDEALLAYAQAEQVQPEHLTPGDRLALHNNRGATLLALGRRAEARRSYAKALRIMPDYAPTVQALAALQALEGMATRNSAADDLGRRGLAAMVSGDLAVAEEALRASLQVQPEDRIHLALGLVLERRGKLPEAAQLYRELLASANSPAVLVSAHRRLAGLGEGELAP